MLEAAYLTSSEDPVSVVFALFGSLKYTPISIQGVFLLEFFKISWFFLILFC